MAPHMTADELHASVGCGLFAARVITEIFPRECGGLAFGSLTYFGLFGLSWFINEFPMDYFHTKSRLVGLFGDNSGNAILMPLNSIDGSDLFLYDHEPPFDYEADYRLICPQFDGDVADIFTRQAADTDWSMFMDIRSKGSD